MNPKQKMAFGAATNPQIVMNPRMMQGMNPAMVPGMNPAMMPGMNPVMMPGMNPAMMPGMNPAMMPGMNPAMMKGLNPAMMPWMMPGMMKKAPLTEQQKLYYRKMGYLWGKYWAKYWKIQNQKLNNAQKMRATNKAPNNQPQAQLPPAKGKITINFKKGGSVTKITMDSELMVAELIDEYFRKTNTEDGNFSLQGEVLTPLDPRSLSEAGLRNGSEIIVS